MRPDVEPLKQTDSGVCSGFAYNSSQIGSGRAIHGPAYVPENHFGGER